MKISIQGQKASYSHIAANQLFGEDIELMERDNFTDVFEDLNKKKVDAIVIPIENSTYGSIYQNYDNLTKYNFKIVAEIYLKINFHLIAHPGVKIEDIEEIHTHPVGMAQIQSFLKENPQINAIQYEDTAGAVKMIREKHLMHAAAAASRFAADFYEMEILKEDIHENPKNYTRFYALKNNGDIVLFKQGQQDKTTIEFLLGEESGSLYKSLRSFADRDISLTKIESRPIIGTDWEYRFYLDIMAGEEEEKLKNALNELKAYAREIKIIGSYKNGETINT
jgi:prephenate dehydratase